MNKEDKNRDEMVELIKQKLAETKELMKKSKELETKNRRKAKPKQTKTETYIRYYDSSIVKKKEDIVIAVDPDALAYGKVNAFYKLCKSHEDSLIRDMSFEEFVTLDLEEQLRLSKLSEEEIRKFIEEL